MSINYQADYGKLAAKHLSVEEARDLAVRAWMAVGVDAEDAAIAADHVLDASLRGFTPFGIARILAFKDYFADRDPQPIKIVRETAQSAVLDGGDGIGYVAAYKATEIAITKAKENGIAVVAAHNTFGTGLLAYYCEMVTRQGLVAMVSTGGTGAGRGRPGGVAPYGSLTPMLGTNPIAFGFPTEPDPVIWDIGTAAIMSGDVHHRAELDQPLPDGVALDGKGNPTVDVHTLLSEGTVKTWGGAKGFGLSVVIQLLAMLSGPPEGARGIGFFLVAIDPSILTPLDLFQDRAERFAEAIHNAEPIPGYPSVRMPYERSIKTRREQLVTGIDVPQDLYDNLQELIESAAK
jgi:LDH2 family malate/lactate/ureidoglycolate dehydrogenase